MSDAALAQSHPGGRPPAGHEIPIEDILAFRSKNLSHAEIAKLIGCAPSNVTQRLQVVALESLENFRQYKDVALEHTQREILRKLSDKDIASMSGLQKITGVAILEDKIRTIRGQATQITDHRVISARLEEIHAKIAKVEATEAQVIDVPRLPDDMGVDLGVSQDMADKKSKAKQVVK